MSKLSSPIKFIIIQIFSTQWTDKMTRMAFVILNIHIFICHLSDWQSSPTCTTAASWRRSRTRKWETPGGGLGHFESRPLKTSKVIIVVTIILRFPPGNGILTSSSQRASCWRNSLLASSASLSPLRRRNLTLRKKLRSHQPAKSRMFRRDMFFLLASRLVEKTVVVVGDSITPTHLQPLPYFWNHKRDFFSPGSSAGDRLGCKYIGRGQEGWRGRCGQGGTPPGWLCHLSIDLGWVITYLLSFWMHDMHFCEHQNV